MKYPDRLVITRAGEGTTDEDTGNFVPGLATTLYDGQADVQDEPRVIERNAEGVPTKVAYATAFLKDERQMRQLREGDTCAITFGDGFAEDAEVLRVNRFEGSLYLGRV